MDAFSRDIRIALRSLRRRPGFFAVALLTLGLGIGANASVFTALDAILLRPLPFPRPEQLMRLYIVMPGMRGGPARDITWSYPKYRVLKERQEVFRELATFRATRFDLVTERFPEQIDGEIVGEGYLGMLGVRPVLGRPFLAEDNQSEASAQVALLSHGLWTRVYGSDPGVLGRSIRLSGADLRIVGVLPAGFTGLTGGADVWVPTLFLGEEALSWPGSHNQHVLARLQEGVSPEQARLAVAAIGRELDRLFPWAYATEDPWGAGAVTLQEERVDPALRTALLLLFGAVGMVLLIACVNLANLLLARSAARAGELAVRKAVGAGRRELVRQMLAESLVLAGLGGLLGLALAFASLGLLRSLAPAAVSGDVYRGATTGLSMLGLGSMGLDVRVLLFVVGLSLSTVLLFGLGPALVASASEAMGALRGSGSQQIARSGFRWWSSRSGLVVAEVALTFLLLLGAGALLEGLSQRMAQDRGYRTEGVWTGRVSLPYPQVSRAEGAAFFRELESRLAALPQVEAVGTNACAPLSPGCQGTDLTFSDRPSELQAETPMVEMHPASPGFFQALGIPVARGRGFTSGDDPASPYVALVSQSAAVRYWGGEDPIGTRISLGQEQGTVREVVGVVPDVGFEGSPEAARPQVFIPAAQFPRTSNYLALRTSASPLLLTDQVREVLREMNPQIPLTDVRTMVERRGDATSRERFAARLLSLFAALASVLAAMGIYAVMAFDVAQRTREIGIRMALGAQKGAVLGRVLGRGVVLALVGIGLGLAGSLALGRVAGALLFGIEPHDPGMVAVVCGAVLAVTVLASLLPALRASSVAPVTALREG